MNSSDDHGVGNAGPREMIDPVCGMTTDERSDYHATHKTRNYYFCGTGCKSKFIANPEKYLQVTDSIQAEPAAAPGTIYTCPMHLEIRQEGPGICPKCGMALEPEMPSLDEGKLMTP